MYIYVGVYIYVGNRYACSYRSADRTCLFALLRWRRDPTVRLLVATTHLARNPESEKQLLARGYQCANPPSTPP